MGVALFPTFEHDLPGLNYIDFDGKRLARASDILHDAAESLGVTSLYCFVDHGEIARSYTDLYPEGMAALERVWFPAEAGLNTVNALLDYVPLNVAGIPHPEDVLDELNELKRFLDVAQREGIRFSMLWDI